MASKLCLVFLLASSLAFLLAADATIIRTTVSEVEEENPHFGGGGGGGGGSCSEKLREMGLSSCMRCMEHSGSGGRSGMGRPIRGSECKSVCCGMMDTMGRECMCEGLKSLTRQCQSPSSYEEQIMCDPMMMRKMMEIPTMCDESLDKCNYHMILV